ncbi:siderophore-interacting protein [Agreia sp. VKM Ac-1783]|uniref:siderophore-interacting protein n=1 Tax=Agreia sp. VKM Ac-1783 TaxID=1938889 RepID=UPI000A2ACDE8|nr:siderophore-interacting protein [Agreia sp. VKM Ac-1783]SMQ75433.1 NADPH-dependent ferric siderophore reductase, contains FAD-binding and SIP domains [Agreia sp. VKM Ac-1783]
MAKSTEAARRIKPQASELLTLHVIRRQVITPNMARVTLGAGDIAKFVPMGFDQWFRLFIPIAEEETLSRLPQKLNTLSYAKYLTISKTKRPVLRNYTVRAYREVGVDGPELDVDFVLHGDAAAGTAGPAASWAARCEPGDAVAILDEGIGFVQPVETDSVVLVADETGLPAVAGVLASLPADTVGIALIEVPTADDIQDLVGPAKVDVRFIVRPDAHATPGRAVLAAAEALPALGERCFAWTVGESALVAGARRHWIATGVPKENIMFCGYWKASQH